MNISRKPLIQFKPNGASLCSCIRKILLISPLKELCCSNKTIYYCNVYTKQEYFENGELIFDRTNERMVAFGACAEMLQLVNYKTHNIGLSYFMNYKHQNVIYAFHECDNEHWTWQDVGYLPSKIREYEQKYSFLNPHANCKIEKFDGLTYYGCKITNDGGRLGCWKPHKYTKEELINECLELEPGQNLEFAIISNYGSYKTYEYKLICYANRRSIYKTV